MVFLEITAAMSKYPYLACALFVACYSNSLFAQGEQSLHELRQRVQVLETELAEARARLGQALEQAQASAR